MQLIKPYSNALDENVYLQDVRLIRISGTLGSLGEKGLLLSLRRDVSLELFG